MTGQVSIYFTIGCFTSLSKTKIMQQLLLEKLLVRALHFDWLIALVKQKTHFLPFIVLHLKCFNYIFYNIFNIFMYLWYLNSPPTSIFCRDVWICVHTQQKFNYLNFSFLVCVSPCQKSK